MKKILSMMLVAFCLMACNAIDKQLAEFEKAVAAQDLEKAEQIYESLDINKMTIKQSARWTEVTMQYSALKTQKLMEESAKQTQELMEKSQKQMNSLFGY